MPKKLDTTHLNEGYLNNLIEENQKKPHNVPSMKEDTVSHRMSSPQKVKTEVTKKADEKEFSFASYVFKFVFFLGVVLGLFYGIVQLMKKGVLTKGKLSFLNNSKLIEVLNTTYVSPKRSLLLVKVHNQVFLVSNSENGLNYMTELADTTSLIKETEKTITGSNFDDSYVNFESSSDLQVKMKEDIYSSTEEVKPVETIKKDVVKFSEQLKKKAKSLKPIENRVN
jgi:flagellar biogenesis protein FliO